MIFISIKKNLDVFKEDTDYLLFHSKMPLLNEIITKSQYGS